MSTDDHSANFDPIVNRAAGLVAVQANCRLEQAFELMHARAEEVDVTLSAIAQAVLERSIDFS